jgi:phosphoketolase
MKPFDNPKKKTYCYKNTCKVVQTGFHLNQYYVCSECKEEVSTHLKEIIEERKKEGEDEPGLFGWFV